MFSNFFLSAEVSILGNFNNNLQNFLSSGDTFFFGEFGS